MELVLILLFNIVLFAVVGRNLHRLYRDTLPEPSNDGLIYRERNGGTVSVGSSHMFLHLTKPFVTLHMYEEKILLNYGGQKVDLLYSDIIKVESVKLLFSKGIIIHHNNLSQPTFLRFWSKRSMEIKNLIDARLQKSAL